MLDQLRLDERSSWWWCDDVIRVLLQSALASINGSPSPLPRSANRFQLRHDKAAVFLDGREADLVALLDGIEP